MKSIGAFNLAKRELLFNVNWDSYNQELATLEDVYLYMNTGLYWYKL